MSKTRYSKVTGKPLFVVNGTDEIQLLDGTKVKFTPEARGADTSAQSSEPKDYNIDEIFQPLIDNPSLTLTTTYWNEAKAQLYELITKEAEIYPEKGIGSIKAVRAVPLEAIERLFNIKEK